MSNKDVASKVVERICELIETGASLPWVKPWGRKPNTVTVVDGHKVVTIQPTAWRRNGKDYKGANTYLPTGEYISWSQAKAEHASVNKGARSFPVVYWNFTKKTKHNDETGEDEEIVIPVLKYYRVFRVEDCHKVDADGKPILDENGNQIPLKPKHTKKPRTVIVPITHEEIAENGDGLNDDAEAVIADYIKRAGNNFKVLRESVTDDAYYSPMMDYVSVPMRQQFTNESEFYSTLFHELGHSTGHKTRLNRFTGKDKIAAFGDEAYSREELVAESTAAGILNALGMEEGNTFRNSAAYIKGWASHIKEDPMMYITATTRAQAAIDLILGVEDEKEESEGEEEA